MTAKVIMSLRSLTVSFLLFVSCKPGDDDTASSDADGDGVATPADCDDAVASTYPGAPEICDEVDNDCDGAVDNDATFGGRTWYVDADGDTFGGTGTTVACEQPDGYAASSDDCDDVDPDVYPGAPETDCDNPVDSNCDGSVGGLDGDDDGFIACEDCNDKDAAINDDATEACDGIDNNCDGDTDEAGATGALPFYADSDDDSYGDPTVTVDACEAPTGFVADDEDCDDEDKDVNPAGTEACNGADDDCNTLVDDDPSEGPEWYADVDGDGQGDDQATLISCDEPSGYVGSSGDCDDLDDTIYAGATESCDTFDSNCDGDRVDGFANYDDDLDPDCTDDNDDNDADPDATDCGDTDPTVYIGAPELCDATDSDCDDDRVDGFPNFDSDADPDCVDLDDDGDADPDTTDCDDTNSAVHAGAPELCDAIDSDCDGNLVDTFPNFDTDAQPDCIDLDDDNDSDPDSSDCADTNPAVRTGATESCDAVDSNCNGSLVDGFVNFDGDSEPDCVDLNDDNDPTPDTSDCNDANATIYVGATETCDAIDSNCNGSLVDGFVNFDGDPEPDCVDLNDDNDPSPDSADCLDNNASAYPGATEIWYDGIDQDCAGGDDFDQDKDGHKSKAFGGDDCDDTSPLRWNTCFDGSSPSNAGISCKTMKVQAPTAPSGLFWADPDGDGNTSDAFQVYCDMVTDGGGFTLALVQPVGVNWGPLVPSNTPPLDPAVATSNVLHYNEFVAMGASEMYVWETGGRRVLKFYYPRGGVQFVDNYRAFTERVAFNSSHYANDAPHTGIGRASPGHANQACSTGDYTAWKNRTDCNVDATNSHPSWGNNPGASSTYSSGSQCWFYGGANMSAVNALSTCPLSAQASWAMYNTGAMSGQINLWIR